MLSRTPFMVARVFWTTLGFCATASPAASAQTEIAIVGFISCVSYFFPTSSLGQQASQPLPVLLQVPSNPSGSQVNFLVLLPPNYNPAATNSWVLWSQGDGGSVFDIFNPSLWANTGAMASGLLAAGYVVVATDFTSSSDWGNPASGLDIATALSQARLQFNLDPLPFVYAGSMGGIRTLNAIAHGQLKARAIEMAFPIPRLAPVTSAFGMLSDLP